MRKSFMNLRPTNQYFCAYIYVTDSTNHGLLHYSYLHKTEDICIPKNSLSIKINRCNLKTEDKSYRRHRFIHVLLSLAAYVTPNDLV